MDHLIKLMDKAGVDNPKAMLLDNSVLEKVKTQKTAVRSMLTSLAGGDHDEFMTRANALGIGKDQAKLAIRDTAALAAIVMQVGQMDCW